MSIGPIEWTAKGLAQDIDSNNFISYATDQELKTLLDQSLTDAEWDRLFVVSEIMKRPLDIKRIGTWNYKNFDAPEAEEPMRIFCVEVSEENTVSCHYFCLEHELEGSKESLTLLASQTATFMFPESLLGILNNNDVTIS